MASRFSSEQLVRLLIDDIDVLRGERELEGIVTELIFLRHLRPVVEEHASMDGRMKKLHEWELDLREREVQLLGFAIAAIERVEAEAKEPTT